MRPSNSLAIGVLVGYAIPLAIVAPALFWGELGTVLAEHHTHFLIPAFTLLLLPGHLAGLVAARRWRDRRLAWRFASGLFLGASLAAGLLFWAGTEGYEAWRRATLVAFGGPVLAGFWLWLGALLGLATGYGRRAAAEPAPPTGFL